MVNSQNVEVELTDEVMKKWIGSREDYYIKKMEKQKPHLKSLWKLIKYFKKCLIKHGQKHLSTSKKLVKGNVYQMKSLEERKDRAVGLAVLNEEKVQKIV